MKLNTHLKIDISLSGEVIDLKKDYAKVILKTTPQMVADEFGLIHGGFSFSGADYAAMAAINHPNVVLTKAEVKFLAPVKLEDTIIFEAFVKSKDEKKATVEVIGKVKDKEVFKGLFFTYITSTHILA